jgi:hypothetical protein
MSRKCESINISQSYRPPWPVAGIALPLFSLSLSSGGFIVNYNNYP